MNVSPICRLWRDCMLIHLPQKEARQMHSSQIISKPNSCTESAEMACSGELDMRLIAHPLHCEGKMSMIVTMRLCINMCRHPPAASYGLAAGQGGGPQQSRA